MVQNNMMQKYEEKLKEDICVCARVSVHVPTFEFFCKTVHIKQFFWVLLPIIPHAGRVLLVSIATQLWQLDRIAVETNREGVTGSNEPLPYLANHSKLLSARHFPNINTVSAAHTFYLGYDSKTP